MWEDPWEEIRRFERRMNRLFEDFWGRTPLALTSGEPSVPALAGEGGIREPFTDIRETDDEIIISAEMPGVKKGDIKIDCTEDSVELSAETKVEKEEKEEGYLRRERSYSSFQRRYSLPSSVDPAKAQTNFNNGVLELRLPKIAKKKHVSVKVA